MKRLWLTFAILKHLLPVLVFDLTIQSKIHKLKIVKYRIKSIMLRPETCTSRNFRRSAQPKCSFEMLFNSRFKCFIGVS